MKKHFLESWEANTPEAEELIKLVDKGEYRSGDCYISSRRFAMKIDGDYVEGVVFGGHPRRKILHAWVEKDGNVYDPTIPEATSKEKYYSIYNAKPHFRSSGINASLKSSKENKPGPVGDIPNGFMESFKCFALNEMPISKFQLIGKWGAESKKRYGYSDKDTGILENPKSVKKIHKHWSNSKHDFDLYFLRSYEGMKHVEVGEVSSEWVQENLKIDILPKKDNITIIFTNNRGTEKIPLTAWALAHRLGHAIKKDSVFEKYFSKEIEKDFFEILKYVYGINPSSYSDMKNYTHQGFLDTEKAMKSLFSATGKMKSARENKLVNRYEFVYELVAQYITTGKILFNNLPKSLVLSRRMAWGKPNYRVRNATDEIAYKEYNETLHNNALKYEYYLDTVFNGLVGKIFVM